MKQIFLKEVRELALRSAALTAVLSTPVALVLWMAYNDDEPSKQVLTAIIPMVLLCSGSIAAILLGCLQTVFEVRRDQWAFLMHRGVSATQIFLGKVAAGVAMYLVITLVPVGIAVCVARSGGVYRFPFAWSLVVPMLTAILAALGFYFTTILGVVWKGPWKVGRLFPAVTPIAALFLSAAIFQITEYVPIRYLLLLILISATLGIAAWSVFVCSGEAAGRPRIGTACLGAVIYPAVLLLLPLLLVVTESAVSAYYMSRKSNVDQPQIETYYLINSAGHVCEVKAERDSAAKNFRVSNVIDLQEPESQKYRRLKGVNVNDLYSEMGVLDWDPLPKARVWNEHWLLRLAGIESGERILQEVGRYGSGATFRWIYSQADGLLYAYTQERAVDRNGRSFRKPPQFMAAVSPEGFAHGSQRPRRRFSRFVGIYSSDGRAAANSSSTRTQMTHRGPQSTPPYFILFEDGLYYVIGRPQVQKVLAAPEGQKIRQIVAIHDKFAVVYEHSISVHDLLTETFEPDVAGTTSNPLPGKLAYSVPIPRGLSSEDYFEFGRVHGKNEVIFNGFSRVTNQHLVIRSGLDGTILERSTYGQPHPLELRTITAFVDSALLLPAAPVVLGLIADAVNQSVQGTGQGVYLRFWQSSPVVMFLITLLHLGMAAACWWLAGRTARRYGFDSRTRRTWQILALLFGVPGLLTLWFLRDWPAREVCAGCGKKRPVDNAHCPSCGERAPVPANIGTEILLDSPALAPQAA